MRSIIVAIFLAFIASPALAQDKVSQIGTWVTECKIDRMTDKRVCDVLANFANRAEPNYDLKFFYNISTKKFMGTGIPAPTRIRAKVDSNEPFSLDVCTNTICTLLKQADNARLLRQMREGSTVVLEFSGYAKMPDPFTVSLSGFDAMYQLSLAGTIK
jgi:invasion protein IalB